MPEKSSSVLKLLSGAVLGSVGKAVTEHLKSGDPVGAWKLLKQYGLVGRDELLSKVDKENLINASKGSATISELADNYNKLP
ncbi:MAG TPA: hypothetical protein VFI61_02470 [Patescibacteria group bacterium]|nr:hypothetical protein [Patescibacteria group bacterium]